ncbi:efflux RND transporter periplasmic adaptor subunit [Noviherbaspirillum galbum]|uniref:Efflux RND transporter periplasmic adaptor subunit n=1 Tax=Noviherbaspirillum galbum TaxID=2709383 RepID=A0A6B3SMV3_9BURK|nr:efflux RND transporter periplasmic adaptor subunit [Noviherbaspirillum galbum]NEX60655.1 efflux RND transporter periplasmic adaptor subunit [Noviherbaspirillum galbum]
MHSFVRVTGIVPALSVLSLSVAASLLAGCGEKSANAQTPAAPPPAEVSVVTVKPERLVISTELPGRIESPRIAQVRARVPGIVQQRVFREGSDVKAGDVLFKIDPAPYQANVNSAQATLAKAEANQAQANLKVQRYQPLVQTNAISKQEFDEAGTAAKQAAADVAAARAALTTARLNLGYATVTAPISGRVGRAQVTEGALVGQGEATPLATVQQLNPIYVTMTQSSAEMLKLQRSFSSGQLKSVGRDQAKVTLVTDDGKAYGPPGKLLFSDLTVDENTGAVSLRAEFPNPERLLLPGMYARARLEQAVDEQAITVPQQAVNRTPDGASVLVVGPDNKVALRPIQTGAAQGNTWIVTQGLKAGEQVIVEGLQKVKPGAPVKAVPWKNAAGNAAPTPQAGPGPAPAPAQSGQSGQASQPATKS